MKPQHPILQTAKECTGAFLKAFAVLVIIGVLLMVTFYVVGLLMPPEKI